MYTALVEWEAVASGGYVVSGILFNIDASIVTLAVTDGRVSGTVRVPGRTYRIRPRQNSQWHEIFLVAPAQPPLGEPLRTCGVGAERRVCGEDEPQ